MPTITLTTDFGLQDGHVGAMKGVMHTIAPNATIVDISHHIPPQDIRHGGFVLMTAYSFWPTDTIHCAVVDPGVGTGRRAIAAKTSHGIFVAPDNGVLSYVLAREHVITVVSLANPAYWHQPVSNVFHGRDIFGPVAAYLSTGISLFELGDEIDPADLITMNVPAPHRHSDGHVTAHIQHIDSFGNCTTDAPSDWVRAGEHWTVHIGDQVIERIDQTFGDVAEGKLVALVDSTDFVAVAVRNGSAARSLKLSIGDPVQLFPKSSSPSQPLLSIPG